MGNGQKGRAPIPVGGGVGGGGGGGAAIAITTFENFKLAMVCVQPRNGKTKLITASGRTEKKARAKLHEELRRFHDEDNNRLNLTKASTFSTAIRLWGLELSKKVERGELQHRTATRYRSSARIVEDKFGQLALRELDARSVNRWVKSLSAESVSRAHSCRVVLKDICRMAVRDGALKDNPMEKSTIRLPRNQAPHRALTEEEITELRKVLRPDPVTHRRGPRPSKITADVVDLQLAAGLSLSDVLALRAKDITGKDAKDTVEVHIRGTVIVEDERKGGTPRIRVHPRPKSDPHRRRVTVSGPVAAMLRARAGALTMPEDLIFASRTGSVIDPSNWRRTFNKMLTGSAVAWVKPETIRKSTATASNSFSP